MRPILAILVAVLASLPAQASVLRFEATAAGNVVATGNALGLAKQANANGPGTADSIGTFTSLDPLDVDDAPANPGNPWPAATTNDWTQNGSAGVLALPAGAEVLYAELIWGGSTNYGGEDVGVWLDTPVEFSTGAASISVAPDPSTALTIAQLASQGFAANDYLRSADVTDFVVAHGAAAYAVAGVPATQATTINSLNAAGWTLVVAYRDSTQPIRALRIAVGGSLVDENGTEDYTFAGFCTPAAGDFDGFAVLSALEGDANLTGDGVAIAASAADPFVPLSGVDNAETNFFASQINGADGALDMAGTFGSANHDAASGVNVAGARQGWDVTRVPLSSLAGHLANGQQSAVLRALTTGDSFVPVGAGLAIDVAAPDFSGDAVTAGAEPPEIALGQTSDVTIAFENTGLVAASAIVFTAPLPAELALASFATDGVAGDIGGNPVAQDALASGVDLGTLAPGALRTVTMVVRAIAAPAGDVARIQPAWDYQYQSCPGDFVRFEPYTAAELALAVPESSQSGAAIAALVAIGGIAWRRRIQNTPG